ncbi:MAG: Asp-tRNA(Asn)/Glu-tRNA(Gln) amidotransferase subunit GatC [Pseudomonadales bacterium]
MALQGSDIDKLAVLARLKIDNEIKQEVAEKISDILSMIDQMQAVDTSAVLPMANPHDATQRLRADVISETNQREAFQAIAPQTEDGLYLVPKVID